MQFRNRYMTRQANYISSLFKIVFLATILLFSAGANAQISQVGTPTTAAANGVQTLSINKPEGVQPGDIMFLNIAKYNPGSTLNPTINNDGTAGWTLLAGSGIGGSNNYRGAILYKIVTETWEPASYTIIPSNYANNNDVQAAIIAYRGVDLDNPFNATGSFVSPGTGGRTISIPAINTTTTNTLILQLSMSWRTGNNAARTYSSWTTSTSGTLTETYDFSSITSVSLGAAARLKPTTGSTGNGTITLSDNNTYRGGIMLALNPTPPLYYRTRTSWQSWDNLATWESSTDGLSWGNAIRLPIETDLSVTIQNGHNVTVSTGFTTANNLIVNGTLNISGSSSFIANTANINGTLQVENTATFSGTGITFNAGSTYNHNRDGGTIPTATWNVNSTALISGITGTRPEGFGQNFGNFTWQSSSQNANISFAAGLGVIGGNLTIANTGSASLNLMFSGPDTYTNTVNGDFIQTGGIFRLAGNEGSGAANITLNIGGNFTLNGGTFDVQGNITYGGTGTVNANGNVSLSSGTLTETGSGTANFNFTGTNANRTYSRSNTTISNTINFAINPLSTVDFGTSILNGSNGTFTLNSNATIITANTQGISNSGNSGSIQTTGVRTYNASANYVYNGQYDQVSGNGLTNAANLTINVGRNFTLTAATNVSGVLSLQSGVVATTSTTILRVTNTSANAIVGGSESAYVSGPLLRNLPASSSIVAAYNFPVGTGTYYTNPRYYPFTLNNPITGTGIITATVQAFAANAGGSSAATIQSMSSSEYWQLSTSGNLTNSKVSVSRPTAIAPFNSIAGSTTQTGTYNLLNGTFSVNGVTNSDNIGTNRFFRFAQKASTFTVSRNNINTFSYVEGNGPSATESLLINGAGLSGNVQLTAPQNFEISLTGGTGFAGSQVVNIPAVSGQVSNAAVYIRMKAGLSQGAIPADTLKASTPGMSTQNVLLSGNVTVRPVITITPGSLSNFNYKFASGPSAAQSFMVMGSNLSGNITLTAPANYEISTSQAGTYSSTLSVGSPQSVYVRLKTNLGVGTYNEVLTATSPTAETKQLQLNGLVGNAPTLTASTSWLSGFIYTSGTTPAVQQSFVLHGYELAGNVTVTAPANFLISTTSNGTYGSSLTLTPTGGTINQTIFVRIATGLAVGTYGPSNIQLSSPGAVVKTVALSGQVVSSATILVSKTSVSGLGYLIGNGPSGVQPLIVSGASLGGNITINAPTNFEISANGTTGFNNSLILTSTSGRVNPTQVYIRLKAGLSANDYIQNLSVSATSATTRNVSLNGKVYASPLISAVGGGDYCSGSTINLTSTGEDIMNRFWSGPNGFYSITQNPTISNSTDAMSGTYTVTGNVVVGGNLIVNGDFEMGNIAFGSSYGTPPTPYNTNSLVPEGLYAVVDLPSQVHYNFSNTAVDKTPAPGTKQMVINGNTVPGVVVWTQSVAVVPNADYEFTYWVQSVVNGGDTNPSQLQLYVNGVSAGPVYTANTATGVWTQFIYNTNSGTNQILNLELINQNTIAGGNDFALDDIVFQQILSASDSAEVSVNNSLPVSVSVNYSPNPVYENTPVTFTATPVNPGTNPVYNWTVNGNAAGTNSSTFTYTPQNGDVVRCELISSYPCATGNPASDTKSITVIKLNNYWMGSSSPSTGSNWGTPSNWTAGYVPLAGDNVEYATVANFGSAAVNDLQLDIDRTIGSLINATTRKLIIPTAKALTVNNSVITDGNPDRIIIKASENQPNGSLVFNNPQNLPVNATVEMYSPASWDLSQPAGLKYNWQYFGIPVKSLPTVPSLTGAYVREKLESGTTMSNHWQQLGNESVLQPFIGYELCQSAPKVYTFKGELVNSNFNSGPLAVTTTAIYPGQHLFANPYTAAIDIRQINFGSSMEASVYMYNTGTFGQWSSVTGNKVGGTPGQYVAVPRGQAGYSGVPRQVPSMNTILVRALAADANAYISFNYSETVMRNNDRQRVREERSEESIISTLIEVKSENTSDKMWLFSDESYSRGFDNGNDGRKIEGNALNPQIYAEEFDGNYQINAIDDFNNTQISFRAGQDTEYKLEFTHTNTETRYAKLFLHDMVTNKVTDISESGSAYYFTAVSTPSAVKRFRILTQPVSEDIDSNISIFNSQNTIYVRNTGSEYGKAYVYDIAGRLIATQNISPASVNAFNVTYHEAYIVKVDMPTDNVVKKLSISK